MRSLTLAIVLLVATGGPPPQVLRVFPPDGSTPGQVPAITAELDFTRGEPGDAASLRLLVDGVDVTAQSRITQTRDWPPSFVSISYTPARLQPGTHRAEVRFRTATGATVGHAWTFAVKPP
ncbi:MAG TPA: hypothetical protein VGV13_18755 [Methylomirabilota bacterium]|jgi:hypothetical protein|nr:hypothetical protein [Methylomirabilota bacterium]